MFSCSTNTMSFNCTFLTGIYSRGKSQILRLSVPIQLLLSAFANQHDEVHFKSIHFMQFNEQSLKVKMIIIIIILLSST